MKRFRFVIAMAMVLAAALGLGLLHWLIFEFPKPRWVPHPARVVTGPQFEISYEFWTPDPFARGQIWVSVWATNEHHLYLCDLEKPAMLGELLHADSAFARADGSRLFCVQREGPAMARAREIWGRLRGWFGAKRFTPHPDEVCVSYWSLDVARNSAVRLGEDYQFSSTSSSFLRSPDGHFGYTKPWRKFDLPELLIADLASGSFRREAVAGEPVGWWDDHQILLSLHFNEFNLYDVNSGLTLPLVKPAQLAAFFAQARPPGAHSNNFASAVAFGSGREFFLRGIWPSAGETLLGHIERPTGALRLLDAHFEFSRLGQLDEKGEAYVYGGPAGGGRGSGVWRRDRQTGEVRELVPSDPGPLQSSCPKFYHGDVIYVRSNAVWRIGADGTQNRRIFPPPEPGH